MCIAEFNVFEGYLKLNDGSASGYPLILNGNFVERRFTIYLSVKIIDNKNVV